MSGYPIKKSTDSYLETFIPSPSLANRTLQYLRYTLETSYSVTRIIPC
ncbi:MAG: hypothetical protein MI742_09900 [Desulfobacterales bacterium]|nr:hypothetical protein [Desulfobacterales bacterium]